MSPKQAIAAALKIDPKRTYCASRQDWKHRDAESPSAPVFRLSVLPGLNGTDCQEIVSLIGFSACVAEYRRMHAILA
jgi:hypothetical protein